VGGYEIPIKEQIETDGSDLVQLAKSANKVYSKERKEEFLGELMHYAKTRGFKDGWASHKYKQKFGVWPNAIAARQVDGISEEVRKFIVSQNIRRNYEVIKNAS